MTEANRVKSLTSRGAPNARLHVVAGGGHDLVVARADEVAPLIRDHLR